MSVQIDSTSDTKEQVDAVNGADKPSESVVDNKPAAPKEEIPAVAEKTEVSDASKKEDEPAEDKAALEATEVEKKSGNGFKKRVDKLNARLSEKDKEILRLQTELSGKQAADKTEPLKQAAKAKSENDEPSADDFTDHIAYVKALTRWEVGQTNKANETKSKEAQAVTEWRKTISDHETRVDAFEADHADFAEKMKSIGDIPVNLAVQDAILRSENGPELMYALANHREEYERIAELPHLEAARELGKFEAKYVSSDSPTETKTITTSKAPLPLKTVSAKSSGAQKSPDAMEYQEYKKWRQAQA